MPYLPLGDKFVGRVGAIWELYDSLFQESTTVVQGWGLSLEPEDSAKRSLRLNMLTGSAPSIRAVCTGWRRIAE